MRIPADPVAVEALFLVTYRGWERPDDVPAEFRIALEAIAGALRKVAPTVWLVKSATLRCSSLYDTLRMYCDVRDALLVARVFSADLEAALAPEVRRWVRATEAPAVGAPTVRSIA